MSKVTQEKLFNKILEPAGVKLNGDNPWDIKVHNSKLYNRIIKDGSLGFGEAYMEGWWESEKLDDLFFRILCGKIDKKIQGDWRMILRLVWTRIINMQTPDRAFEVGEKHYDVGNDLYGRMLDRRMIYTCGYWKGVNSLDEAQENKLDLVCKKIGLKKGDKVLDIGCGWGGFLKFAAEKYEVEGVGVTISKEQAELARESCQGLPIEIRLQDYRGINEKFDHIVSLGMFEHVGVKNYRTFMKVANKSLKDGGLFLLHTIGGNKSVASLDPWIEKYIFPNSMLPSIKQIAESFEGLFVMEDWHNFSVDYDKTLMAWFNNFNNSWSEIKDDYNEKFYRMWKYYLLCCAGSFRARKNQLWQIVLSKDGCKDGYCSIR